MAIFVVYGESCLPINCKCLALTVSMNIFTVPTAHIVVLYCIVSSFEKKLLLNALNANVNVTYTCTQLA